jgi:DNA-binding NarL/FixJ family response regulator
LSITVSIIEDDVSVRQILTGWIDAAKGFHCLSAYGGGKSALASLLREAPDILLVDMDINLPDMNGIECVRCLRWFETGGTRPPSMRYGATSCATLFCDLASPARAPAELR